MSGEFTKHDREKPRTDLLDPGVLLEVAEVLRLGAEKYDAHNWRAGSAWSRYYGAALRHLLAFWSGEDNDPETGRPHLAHALCCLMFLAVYERESLGEDDRR